MKNENPEFPETLFEAVKYFADGDRALMFMVGLRWTDGNACCPRCASVKVTFMNTRKVWKCNGCKKQFSIKVGTIFEDSALGLDKWIPAVWCIVCSKNGVSSCELARSLGVTQKTAWFMLHRIRLALQSGSVMKDKIGGIVEVDESYIGGRARFMHKSTKKRRGITGTGMVGKTAVMGLLERKCPERGHSKIVAEVLPAMNKRIMLGKVRQYVLKDAQVNTDALNHYTDLKHEFTHKVVDHAECYVKGNVHTNGLENFWSLLKRGIKGTYVSVEPFHLFRYLAEQTFRFNERKDTDRERFLKAMNGIFGKRLTYRDLIDAECDLA